MNLRIVAMALAVALSFAGQALGQAWAPVTADAAKNQFDLDLGSITANGGFTQSWMRETLAHKARDAVSGKAYLTALTQRLDDCRGHSLAILATVFKDEKGQVTSSMTIPQAEWRFVSPPPGSVAAALQARICEIAARRASLKPSLEIGPATRLTWLPTAYDPVTKTRFFIGQEKVMALSGGVVGVILRAEEAGGRKLSDGTPIALAFLAEAYDCKARTVTTISADSYDAGGALVGVFSPPREKLESQAFAPGSSPDLIAKYVCQPDHLSPRDPADGGEAGQTSTGTAWLGPKGYLVTANHVVENADRLELLLDGKPVGRAEVVVLDPANDIAILKPVFQDGPHVAIPLAGAPAKLGERVFTLGYPAPDLLGVALKMTSGEVSALAGDDSQSRRTDDARFLQVSIPIQSGNSGGPVIDGDGRAVGIVISKMNMAGDEEVAQNVNYALKIAYVRNLLAELPALGPSRPARASASISGLVAELKGSVFLIVASREAKSAP